jgi:hypothetical protein
MVGFGAGERTSSSSVPIADPIGTQSAFNTFVGFRAGDTRDGPYHNTIVGADAGFHILSSSDNTFMGYKAGFEMTDNTGSDVGGNTFVGFRSGQQTNGPVSGTPAYEALNNAFFGSMSGFYNTTGYNNTMIGTNADVLPTTPNLGNAAAIGYNAKVTEHNKMILGNNDVNVGIGLSAEPIGPRNRLEINYSVSGDENTLNGCTTTSTGYSGLQFRDLTENSVPCPSNLNGTLLSVDKDGNVILVPGGGAVLPPVQNALSYDVSGSAIEWGGSAPADALLHDTEVQMVGGHGVESSIFFSGQTSMSYTSPILGTIDPVCVGIGMPPGPVKAKFNVVSITSNAYTSGAPMSVPVAGLFSEAGSYSDPSMTPIFYGVYGSSVVSSPANAGMAFNIGGEFLATASQTINTGVLGTAIPSGQKLNYGVKGVVDLSIFTPPLGSINFGVYGDLGLVGPTTPDFAGMFNGDLGTTAGFYAVSDVNLKTNIQDLSSGMDVINQLHPKSYNFDREGHSSMRLSDGTHYGLLAQDVQNILPDAVKACVHPARYDSLGNETAPAIDYLAINYLDVVPFLIAGMKEQQVQIEAQQQQIDDLNAIVNSHHVSPSQNNEEEQNNNGQGQDHSNAIDVTLSSKTIVLNQNQPNPFQEQTTITYFIPENTKNVKIIFTDSKGYVLKEIEINETGKGQLNVYAQDLSSGTYTYTLVADGVTIDSKKMVCTK